MNLAQKAKKAGTMLGGATLITIALGTTNAMADCSAKITDNKGRVVSNTSRLITSRQASGPKDAWERVCVRYGVKKFKGVLNKAASAGKSLRDLKKYKARIKMVCSGSWRGKWCTELKVSGSQYATGLNKPSVPKYKKPKRRSSSGTQKRRTTGNFNQATTHTRRKPANNYGIVKGNWKFEASECNKC